MSEFQCTCSIFCAILYLKTCCATQGEIIILQSWYDLSLSINAREKIYHESKYSWTEFQFQDKCVNHKFYCVTEKRQEDGKTTRIKIQFLNGLYYMPLKFISKSHTHTHIWRKTLPFITLCQSLFFLYPSIFDWEGWVIWVATKFTNHYFPSFIISTFVHICKTESLTCSSNTLLNKRLNNKTFLFIFKINCFETVYIEMLILHYYFVLLTEKHVN